MDAGEEGRVLGSELIASARLWAVDDG